MRLRACKLSFDLPESAQTAELLMERRRLAHFDEATAEETVAHSGSRSHVLDRANNPISAVALLPFAIIDSILSSASGSHTSTTHPVRHACGAQIESPPLPPNRLDILSATRRRDGTLKLSVDYFGDDVELLVASVDEQGLPNGRYCGVGEKKGSPLDPVTLPFRCPGKPGELAVRNAAGRPPGSIRGHQLLTVLGRIPQAATRLRLYTAEIRKGVATLRDESAPIVLRGQ